MKWLRFGIVLLLLVAAASWLLCRDRGGSRKAVQPADVSLPTQAGESRSFEMADPQPGIMPFDENTLERFQEANSVVMTRLLAPTNGLPYAVAASVSACEAMKELGFDPEQTVLYWMSPRFQQDLARLPPGAKASVSRAVENLQAVMLGKGAGEEEFDAILQCFPPALREAAMMVRKSR